MKAATYSRYGGPEVIVFSEVPKPVPAQGEILVRIHATTVTSADWRARSLIMPRGFGPFARPVFGFSGPRQPILGSEMSGVVESVGAGVTRFSPGDAVVAFPDFSMGCHAEYRTMKADGPVAGKPKGLSFEDAAALFFGGTTALTFLRKANVRSGDRVLVVGASGAVGSAAVQLARHFGAEVTGVTSAKNAELVRSIGAKRTIDYAREDFATAGQAWDIILDAAGTAPYRRSRTALAAGGRLAIVLGSLGDLLTPRGST
jgi:NADPH:quinone reductase-like Zn-dependent oxidoreductase